MFTRLFWGSVIFSIIFVAVCVQVMRAAFPYLDDYREPIAAKLSQVLDAKIEIAEIDAEWDGFRPSLNLDTVSVKTKDGQPILDVNRVELDFSLLATLKDWRLAWRKISFDGLKTALLQHQDGRWTVQGLESSSAAKDNNFKIDDPLDIFLFGRRIELSNSFLTFNFRSGQVTQVEFPNVTLENDADFHRLKAHFDVDEDLRAVALVVEGHGDPRDVENFNAMGYLEFNNFPIEKVIAAFAQDFWKQREPGSWNETGGVDLQLWFEGSTHTSVDFRGHLKTGSLPLKVPEGMNLPKTAKAVFEGHWRNETGLDFGIQNLLFDWEEFSSPELNARLKSSLSSPVQASLLELDLDAWRDIAKKSGASKHKVVDKILSQLKPAGSLKNIQFRLTDKESGLFNLRANLDDVAVSSWRGSPEIKKMNGFVEASIDSGRVVLEATNGFSMHYPTVYHKALDYHEARGELRWSVDKPNSRVLVSSGRMQLKGEDGEGNGHLFLSLPYKRLPNVEPEMTLVVGLRASDAKYHEKYVPFTIPNSLYDWIDRSVEGGDLKNGGFIYRGSLKKKPLRPRAIQLYMDIENGKVAFDPNWPVLTKANASLLVDDMDLNVYVKNAELFGNTVDHTRIELAPYAGHKKGALAIQGRVSGESAQVLELLKNSPIRNAVGDALDQLQLGGHVYGDVDLLVPLMKGHGFGTQKVEVALDKNTLKLPTLNLAFTDISGTLHYRNDSGLSANGLKGNIWSRPISADIVTKNDLGYPSTEVSFNADVEMASLRKWVNRKELMFASGMTKVNGRVILPSGRKNPKTSLFVQSDLEGVTVDLPAPFFKKPERKMAFTGNIKVDHGSEGQLEKYKFTFDSFAQVKLERDRSGLRGVTVGVEHLAEEIQPGKLRFAGNLEQAALKPWIEVVQQYIAEPDSLSDVQNSGMNNGAGQNEGPTKEHKIADASDRKDLTTELEFRIKNASIGDFVTNDLHFSGVNENKEWRFRFQNAEMSGIYRLFEDSGTDASKQSIPGKLDMEYLYLSAEDEGESESSEANADTLGDPDVLRKSYLASMDPSELIDMDVTIGHFKVGEDEFGAWSFELRPEKGVLVAKNVIGSIRGLNIGKTYVGLTRPDPEPVKVNTSQPEIIRDILPRKGEMRWYYGAGRPRTEFVGTVHAADVSVPLKAWEQSEMLSSQFADFDVKVSWNGYPDQISPLVFNGVIDVDIQKGLIQGVTVGQGPMAKLLGLANFNTLARRLRLDFKDLNPEGTAYDRMLGQLDFKEGQVYINEPLVVTAPSSNFQAIGMADLKKQRVDAKYSLTLPLTGNLTLAAAAIGGLPAAVGFFVVGKLFKKQADQISTFHGTIKGPWSKPKVKLKKVSGSEADAIEVTQSDKAAK